MQAVLNAYEEAGVMSGFLRRMHKQTNGIYESMRSSAVLNETVGVGGNEEPGDRKGEIESGEKRGGRSGHVRNTKPSDRKSRVKQ